MLRTEKALLASVALACFGFGWFVAAVGDFNSAPERTLSATAPSVRIPAMTKPVDIVNMTMSAVAASTTITIPEDGWITGFSQDILGVPESSLRFTWVYDTSAQDPYCPEQQRVVFVMSLEKTPDLRFSPGYGYPVTKGTELRIFGGFANFSDAPYESASLSVDLAFVPKSSGKTLGEAYPVFLNAECTSLFVVPPKAQKFTKWLDHAFTIPFDGSMVFLGSHSHKYATDMMLKLNKDIIWRTSPVRLPDGTNLGNPIYKTPFNGVPVKSGDVLDLGVIYSNPNNKPTDAMSSMYIQLIPKTATSTRGH